MKPNSPYYDLEIITNVFGERFYVKEVLYDTKFKLEIYSGRPVANLQGGDRFIVTDELKAFILSTLDVPYKEFNDLLKVGVMTRLRRLLQDNPFKYYEHWVSSKRANKPRYITFNDAQKNPQILIDALGHRYVLLSALRAEGGLIFPMGVLETLFLDKNKITSTKYILTQEVAKWIKEKGFSISESGGELPISCTPFYGLCAELGYSKRKVHDERNTFFVQHLDELIHSTAEAFHLNHSERGLPQWTVLRLKKDIAFLLKEGKNPQSLLIPALLEYWEQPNREAAKKMDEVFGRNSSKIRRAFLVLKKAKRI